MALGAVRRSAAGRRCWGGLSALQRAFGQVRFERRCKARWLRVIGIFAAKSCQWTAGEEIPPHYETPLTAQVRGGEGLHGGGVRHVWPHGRRLPEAAPKECHGSTGDATPMPLVKSPLEKRTPKKLRPKAADTLRSILGSLK